MADGCRCLQSDTGRDHVPGLRVHPSQLRARGTTHSRCQVDHHHDRRSGVLPAAALSSTIP